jgi:hypothetical protein
MALHRSIALILVILFVACLPGAPLTVGETPMSSGLELLGFGWMGLLFGGYVDWIANPLFVIVIILVWRGSNWPKLLTLCAMLMLWVVWMNWTRVEMSNNEGGVMQPISAWHPGFYLWIAALIGASIAALAAAWRPAWLAIVPRR